MQTTNRKEDVKFNDPEWCFLAEYSLTKLMVDMDNPGKLESEVLARITSELGIGAELFSQIERKLIKLTIQTMAQFDQGRYAAPTIRFFSQRKAVEEISSPRSTCPPDIMDNPSIPATIEQPDRDTNGGWGYFIIERSGKTPDDGGDRTCFWIDLFLYREGK